MNTAVYHQLRDELLLLVDRSIGVLDRSKAAFADDEDSTRTLDALRERRGKLQANEFVVLLLGEFGSGKSTLFDTVACEGRELSPVGSCLRTSGCLVCAQQLQEPGSPEYAEVQWRTGMELLAGFDDYLLPRLRQLHPARFASPKEVDGAQQQTEPLPPFNFDCAADRDLLRQAAEQEFGAWAQDKAGYDTGGTGHLDLVRFASLVAEFYDHPEVRNLRQEHKFDPGDVGRFIQYPPDWETRWEAADPKRFRWDEILFIFVRNVRLYLDAPRLARTGYLMMDCPGLFASRYDTAVTDQAMVNADAILYLASGETAVALSDLKVLRQIRSRRMEYKLFVAWNQRTSAVKAAQLLDNFKTVLEQDGFRLPSHSFASIHAALALHAAQAEKLLDGRLDDRTRSSIARRFNVTPDKVTDQVWKEIAKSRRMLDRQHTTRAGDPKALAAAIKESGVSEFLGTAEDFVVHKKARFILVENGAEAVKAILRTAGDRLQNQEQAARAKRDDHFAQLKKAETALAAFEERSQKTLDQLDGATLDGKLVDDFLARLDDGLRLEIAEAIGTRLDQALSFGAIASHEWEKLVHRTNSWFVKNELPPETAVERSLREICKSETDQVLNGCLKAWHTDIEEGRNQAYNQHIGKLIEQVNRQLREDWRQAMAEVCPMLPRIQLGHLSSNLRDAFSRVRCLKQLSGRLPDKELGELGSEVIGPVIIDALAAILAVVGAPAAKLTLLGLTVLTIPQPWLWPLIIAAAVASVRAGFKLKGHLQGRRKKLQEEIEKALAKEWSTFRNGVRTELSTVPKGIRNWYRRQFEECVVAAPRRVFERHKADAEGLWSKSVGELERIATEARRLREERIEPLVLDLEGFADKCRSKFPPTGDQCVPRATGLPSGSQEDVA